MNQKGAVIVVVAALMFLFLGLAALAIDLGYLYVVGNELQNAADAGALAGVRVLYNGDGSVNIDSKLIATLAAQANKSQKLPVEVDGAEVRIGHWNFAAKQFTEVDPPLAMSVQDVISAIGHAPPYTLADLDGVSAFVNALQIVTRRGGTAGGTPATPFFSGLWGKLGFNLGATATGYIGFSQSIEPQAVDKPIAICIQAIMQDGIFSCVTGRMINSSGSGTDTNVGAWTNYSQLPNCSSTSANDLKGILSDCSSTNEQFLFPTLGVSVMNGGLGSEQSNSAWGKFMDCWKNGYYDHDNDEDTPKISIPKDARGYPTKSWPIKILLIDCKNDPFKSIADASCTEYPVVGTVDIEVVWIVGQEDKHFERIPFQMDDWACLDTSSEASREACWSSFTNYFNLKTHDQTDSYTPYSGDNPGGPMAIYVKPNCKQHVGTNSGPLLFSFFPKNPVLVAPAK